jgi:aspartate/methionine/tyrosine aminotransferase
MRKSLLSDAPGNIFQAVKVQRAAAEKAGIKIINLTIGQPAGPAFEQARIATSEAVLSDKENMHEYQDNNCHSCPDFAQRFVKCHTVEDIEISVPRDSVAFLPIMGIKPMLQIVIESLGSWDRPDTGASRVFTMTNPGYGTAAYGCRIIKNVEHYHLPLDPANGFLFDLERLDSIAGKPLGEGDLISLNLPHNPTGVIAREHWLKTVCGFCEERGVRISNDGAYHALAHNSDSVTLADTAIQFPNLNWFEMFSASKGGNFTGWRVGAGVGSTEFVSDIARIKGETDSGFVSFSALGVLHQFEKCGSEIESLRQVYQRRLELVTTVLGKHGMRLAVTPEAGFFLLFDSPNEAFGQQVANSTDFNALMIQKTGIAGIPFGDKGQWIRYAICATDVEAVIGEIDAGFAAAKVAYNN